MASDDAGRAHKETVLMRVYVTLASFTDSQATTLAFLLRPWPVVLATLTRCRLAAVVIPSAPFGDDDSTYALEGGFLAY